MRWTRGLGAALGAAWLGACSCGTTGTDAGPDAGADAAPPDAGGTDTAIGTDGGTTDATPSDSGLPSCGTTTASDLAGVSIAFPDQDCVFTLAEAAAGIAIAYDVVVEMATPDVSPLPQDAGQCGLVGPSGLIVFEQLGGGGNTYCLCDTGLCMGPPGPGTLVVGTHPATFTWMGNNWMGPSDTGNPMGAPFPVGTYTLTVSAIGTVGAGATPYAVTSTFLVHLVP